jgi:hypothetical protein
LGADSGTSLLVLDAGPAASIHGEVTLLLDRSAYTIFPGTRDFPGGSGDLEIWALSGPDGETVGATVTRLDRYLIVALPGELSVDRWQVVDSMGPTPPRPDGPTELPSFDGGSWSVWFVAILLLVGAAAGLSGTSAAVSEVSKALVTLLIVSQGAAVVSRAVSRGLGRFGLSLDYPAGLPIGVAIGGSVVVVLMALLMRWLVGRALQGWCARREDDLLMGTRLAAAGVSLATTTLLIAMALVAASRLVPGVNL